MTLELNILIFLISHLRPRERTRLISSKWQLRWGDNEHRAWFMSNDLSELKTEVSFTNHKALWEGTLDWRVPVRTCPGRGKHTAPHRVSWNAAKNVTFFFLDEKSCGNYHQCF
jgi:hypothetical protein